MREYLAKQTIGEANPQLDRLLNSGDIPKQEPNAWIPLAVQAESEASEADQEPQETAPETQQKD